MRPIISLALGLGLGLVLAENAMATGPKKPSSPTFSSVLRTQSPTEIRVENLLSESQSIRQDLRKYVRKLRRRKTWTAGGNETIYYDAIRDSEEFLKLQDKAKHLYADLVAIPTGELPAHLTFRLDSEKRAMKDTLQMVQS